MYVLSYRVVCCLFHANFIKVVLVEYYVQAWAGVQEQGMAQWIGRTI